MMSAISSERWAELMRDYDAAARRCDLASAAVNALPVAESIDTPEERQHEEALEALVAVEDRLLAVVAPTLAAAAFQLKIFGLRYCSADLDEPEMSGEDHPQGPILRRIHGVVLGMAG